MEKKILKCLRSKRFIHARVICSTLSIKERKLRTHIKSLRRQGYLILSTKDGYKLVRNPKEFDTLEKFAKSILKTINDMKRNHTKRVMPRLKFN